jgi:RNA polymerase sigma-70 factor (ECF subfamily)
VSAVGVATVGELAGTWEMRPEDVSMVAELKAGNEDAYTRLIVKYHRAIYGLVYQILDDPSDAPDTTQEVFFKVFRGIAKFNCEGSLKAWMYRIAIHEASNRRRWFFRHKVQERSIEPMGEDGENYSATLFDSLVAATESPFETVARGQVRARLEHALQELPECYRTTVVLRYLEDLSYEEIAEATEISLGTVKSRLVRGREALRKRLKRSALEWNPEAGISSRKGRTTKLAPESRQVEFAP